jgi:hypothetical protein
MSRSNLSRKALVSQDARTRPIAHRAAFEAQIPTEVLRQNPSRSPVHHEGGAGKAALPIPRRFDRSQDHGRQSPDSRGAAATLESAPRGGREVLTAAGCGLPVASKGPGTHARRAGRFRLTRRPERLALHRATAVLERAGGRQSADGGRIDVVGARDVGLGLTLCKAMQRLVALMRRELAWSTEAHASCEVLGGSILPEPIEAVGAQFGISHCVHDVAMA